MTSFVLFAFIFLTAFIGASLGSFLNVVIWRVPEKMSLSSPPSHCPKCGAPVRWHDNIPIISWFVLRGKCRDCREPISFRYPLVEALNCFIALIVCASIFYGGWTGTNDQCLRWNEFASCFETWKSILANGGPDASSESDLTSFILEDFVRLLFISVVLSVYVMLITAVALMLGFVRLDQKRPPRSLLIASLIVVLLAVPMIFGLNSSDSSDQTKRLLFFVLSVSLGAVPAFFAQKGEKAEFVLLGAAWGVVSGATLALPGSLLCFATASVVRKKIKRNVLGIVVYTAMVFLIIAEFVFSLAV